MILSMTIAMGTVSFAADEDTVSITVTRDTDTYDGAKDEEADSRNFTWYRIFTASYGPDFEGNTGGGGYDSDGTPGFVDGDSEHPVSYTATPEVAAKLGTIDATTKAWTTKADNLWFDLTYIPGTGNYAVSWRKNVETDTDTAQAAAKWLVDNQAYEDYGALTFSGSGDTAAWSKNGLTKGYYVLSSEAGNNLIAATTDVVVKEKNDYPPLDKTQADEDDPTQSDDVRNVAIGDKLDYEVKVTIPKTAKVGDKIIVWDKASSGLTYNGDIAVKSNTGNATVGDYSGTAGVTGATWQKLITVTADSQGKDVVFKFSMTVNEYALTDTDKKNESGLKYGRDNFPYESTPDEVEYITYFAGIEKIDGDTPSFKLANVEFMLKEGNAEFKVSKPSGKDYYIPDPNGSSTVKTDADGLIKIRGLDDDDDKTYTLTETKNPHEGYNMLGEPVTLTLHEDKASVFDDATLETWQDVENYKGTVLPSTGGIGTVIFYVLGSLLVIGCGIVLISRRRMQDK